MTGVERVAVPPQCAVMAFGCNDDGQLGTGERRRPSVAIDAVTASNLPAQIGVLHGLEIAAISCGSRHTLVLTTGGEVYSFGWGSMGQLGHGDLKSSGAPKRIEFFAQHGLVVDYISCGGCHSAAVARDGTEPATNGRRPWTGNRLTWLCFWPQEPCTRGARRTGASSDSPKSTRSCTSRPLPSAQCSRRAATRRSSRLAAVGSPLALLKTECDAN